MGSVASCNEDSPVDGDVGNYDNISPDWETLNDNERESNISNILKKLGNIMMKRRFDPLILKDMLGADADCLVPLLIKNHRHSKSVEELLINDIYRSVKYFSQVFEGRRKNLERNKKNSNDGSYSRKPYWFRNEFRCIVREKRSGKQSNF